MHLASSQVWKPVIRDSLRFISNQTNPFIRRLIRSWFYQSLLDRVTNAINQSVNQSLNPSVSAIISLRLSGLALPTWLSIAVYFPFTDWKKYWCIVWRYERGSDKGGERTRCVERTSCLHCGIFSCFTIVCLNHFFVLFLYFIHIPRMEKPGHFYSSMSS